MDFGSLLKAILNRNDIKMYNLANALGYDKSYISKWINQAKLPPAKDIDRLSDQIAAFVVRECDPNRKRMTAETFGLSQPGEDTLDDTVFAVKLAALLREAYWRSRYNAEHTATDRPAAQPQQPAGTDGIAECILFTQPITRSGLFQPLPDDLQALNAEHPRFRLLAVIDPELFEAHVDLYWKYICRLLRLGSKGDVELVELGRQAPVELPDRLYIVKNAFVEQSVPLPFSRQPVPLRVTTPAVVNAYYKDARTFLQRQQCILESSNVNENLYYYKYSAANAKRYLLSSMFPMYMSEALFEEILEKYGSKTQSTADARKRYLKEFTTKKSVIIYDTALLRYMSTGKVSAFDAYEGETLTRAERKRHLQELIDEMEDGSRLELKILNDKNPIINYDEISVSFFMNDTSAYCSDIHRKKDGVRYFVSPDSRRNLSVFFDHLHALSEEYLVQGKQAIEYIYDGMKNI